MNTTLHTMPGVMDKMELPLNDWVGLLAYADSMEEQGMDKLSGRYRQLADLVQASNRLGRKLMAITRPGQFLKDKELWERDKFVVTARQGWFTDNSILFETTRRERGLMRRRKIENPDRKPIEVEAYLRRNSPNMLAGEELSLDHSNEYKDVVAVVWQDVQGNQYLVDARYVGFLLRRHPRATWRGWQQHGLYDACVLMEGDRLVAVVMCLTLPEEN